MVTVVLYLFSSISFAQAYGIVDPYSVQLKAYKGRTNTDVYMIFSSSNPAKYPIPSALKKLQLKITNASGDVVFLHNEKSLALTGNLLVSSVLGINQHNKVEIQAHIKTAQTKNEEIVRGIVVARLRPDLKVFKVVAPSEVKINQQFQVEAIIKETNLEVGAVCNVSLYKGTTIFGTVPGVNVPAAGTVSVVFEGVSHSVIESKDFSIVISNADPGEYSTANNSHNFTVNFTNPFVLQAMPYDINYYGCKDYTFTSNYSNNDNYSEIYQVTSPYSEGFYYHTYLTIPSTVINGDLSEFSFKIETENGVFKQFAASNLAVTEFNYDDGYCYKRWDFSVPDSKLTGYLEEHNYDGVHTEVACQLGQYGSNRVYIYTYNGQIVYEAIETSPESWFLNAEQLIKISTLITFENTSYGGGTILNIAPYQNYYFYTADSFYDENNGYVVNYYIQENYYDTYNYEHGTTDPYILPSILSKYNNALTLTSKLDDIPSIFSLYQNYPNPFNPTTTICFAIPEAGYYALKVYNTLGQEVSTLVNGQMGIGNYKMNFDASRLSSGIYLYSIKGNNVNISKKMILMK